ncbi:17824_t:CDS:1, partial [Gigaspora rosea]
IYLYTRKWNPLSSEHHLIRTIYIVKRPISNYIIIEYYAEEINTTLLTEDGIHS